MGPYYKHLTAEYPSLIPPDASLASELETKNAEEIKKLDDRIEDATANLGETDISDAVIAKSLYLAQIGDKVGFRKDVFSFGERRSNNASTFLSPTGKSVISLPIGIRKDVSVRFEDRYCVFHCSDRLLLARQ